MAEKQDKEAKPEVKQQEAPKIRTLLTEFKLQLLLLEKAINNKDIKSIQKVSQSVRKFRQAIKSAHLAKIFVPFYQSTIQFDKYEDFEVHNEEVELNKIQITRLLKHPEIDIYTRVLHLIWLIQIKSIEEAVKIAEELLKRVIQENIRYLDTLQSIIYFYYSRAFELAGKLEEIRPKLLAGYRSASLNHDDQGSAVLINLILRNFIHYNLFDQSNSFKKTVDFPEGAAVNELVKYLYYTGLILAIRGQYAEAHEQLLSAMRKSPDNSAFGFKIQVQKLLALVELLLGEVPNRDMFTNSQNQQALYYYYRIVSSVIKGDLKVFTEEVNQNEQVFRKDKLYNLVKRLPQIVIKAGLKRLNLSYSRIKLSDVAIKLKLEPGSNPEQIVAKAIRDGTISAIIDHENGIMISQEKNDIYGTTEPQESFSKRIELCFNLYTSAVKALQYQNPQYDYTQDNNNDEITAEELLDMVDIGDF
ncbi:hypothetical protein pb186bvf_009086 [Paramecium bursaria]